MGAGHIFVSYTSTDRLFADELVQAFEAAGLRIWYAPRDVRPGIDYSEQIQKAIETAIAFVVIVTESSNRSNFVRAETEMAFSRRRPIFPVRTSPVIPASGLALFLQLRHWTDAFGPARQSALHRLRDELAAAAKPAGSRRGGPTLYRPRFLRGTGNSAGPAARFRATVILMVVGAGALILAAILAIPVDRRANLDGSEAASSGAPGNAGNFASVLPGEPNYDPLVENWMRYARENAPPPPDLMDNVVDTEMDSNIGVTTPDGTVEVNGM